MATKLSRKTMPPGLSASDFKYVGRPAKEQDDFGSDVGIADCACVNQFGDANNSKYYHGGVVEASGRWFVYLEWGRIKGSGKSWDGSFAGGDYQFVECSSEADARAFFAKQLRSKNMKRLKRKTVGGVEVWAGRNGKDGYIVQALATRERGLPDAYTIKDDTGVSTTAVATPVSSKPKGPSLSRDYHREEIKLATDLLGGSQTYTRSLSKASGVVPTMDAIAKVRDDLIPAALTRIQSVGNDIAAQVNDKDLQDISRMVFSMVPRQIPRKGLTPEQAILSNNNILTVQRDLDAFETALGSEDWTVETTTHSGIDPDTALNAKLTWLDPNSDLGRWVINTYSAMTRNRHGDLRGRRLRVLNVFSVERPDRDTVFTRRTREIAAKRKGQSLGDVRADLQPTTRPDLSDLGTTAQDANVFFGIHGTRSVNVAPILQSNFRLPQTLKGVQIAGSAFGCGTYFADDYRKSWGYTSNSTRWSAGSGGIQGRGFFMFLCDVTGGKFHYPRSTMWGEVRIPGDADSIYANPRYTSVQNNEYVIMDPAGQQRIRYVVEARFD